MKKVLIFVFIIIAVILVIFLLDKKSENDQNYDFKIYFFDAGKADAMILSKNDKHIMIDTGEESLGDEILKYFEKNKIEKLDYLIITHFDKDHVGSASKIIDNIEIGEVLESNYPKDSEYYNNYKNSLANKNIEPKVVNGDYQFNLDDLNITVNGPEEIYDKNESNNSSLIVSVTYKDNKFLFMADAQNQRIKDFVKINNEKYDFIKVPYHGKDLERLEDLVKDRDLKYAVITSSNTKLEASETIDILNKYNIKYYLTRLGSITIISDGKNIKINQ
jgi:beta-lactamase superfamily II metal-dependent hydrolase